MARQVQDLAPGAFAGLKVLELGQLIAGPFAGAMLAAYGADVVKIEAPGVGDPLRKWRKLHDGTSLWWATLARNKRSVALDLRTEAGQGVVRDLVGSGYDVVIENFRPGRMEAWGLGPDALRAINPRVIVARVSGYGQTGPRKSLPGFANVAEAMGGLRYVTGEPDRPPVRSTVSLGDSIAALHTLFGLFAAIYARDVRGTGEGQVVDVALTEAVFNLLESTVAEHAYDGTVRERAGTALPGVVPSNTYPCEGDQWVVIGANADPVFMRLMELIGRPDLARDPALARNDGRVPQAAKLDAAIAAWTRTQVRDDALEQLHAAGVPAGAIQSAADLATDPQLRAREMFEAVTLGDGTVLEVPTLCPKLSANPPRTRWIGPELGAHTDELLRALGRTDADLAELRASGVIA